MNLLSKIKERSLAELLICFLSLLTGCFLVYDAIYFMWVYHFSNGLYLFMLPMTRLIPLLIIGLLLVISPLLFIYNVHRGSILYSLSGILIMLYPLNIYILYIFGGVESLNSLLYLLVIVPGLVLYLFFYRRKYLSDTKNMYTNSYLFIIALISYQLIDLIFFNWCYFGC